MSMSAVDFDYIQALTRRHAGVVLDPNTSSLVELRLRPVLEAQQLSTLGDLMDTLRRTPANGLHVKVVDAILNHETSFFRDAHPFEALQKTIFPALIRARARERQLTVWSTACSSGQEPYSVAMMLLEHFPELHDWRVRIVATDISETILRRAAAGRYTQSEVNRGLPAACLLKYFRQEQRDWQIRDEVRSLVEFRPLNLTGPLVGLPQMDLILLRNVMIYFDLPTRREVLHNVTQVMRPGGALLMGGAETILNLNDTLQARQVGRCTVYELPA